MLTHPQLDGLSARDRLIFCQQLVDALPAVNIAHYLGSTNADLIQVTKDVLRLRSAVREGEIETGGPSPALGRSYRWRSKRRSRLRKRSLRQATITAFQVRPIQRGMSTDIYPTT